ncbi:MAG: DsbA family protein [Pseudomonadales bacterium]|nr:DsbA family protein [Pseudomonadales bacterium]
MRSIRKSLEKIEQQGEGEARKPAVQRPTVAQIALHETGPILGEPSAPVTVVEFTDYECPFCKRFILNTFPSLKRDYIDTGKLRWLVRDLPLPFHAHAKQAAQAAYCAGEQGQFWQMRDSLFRNNKNLDSDNLRRYARELKLDIASFDQCLASDRHLATIDAHAKLAAKQRLTGTPSFIVGKTEAGRLEGKVIIGAQSPAVFTAEIEKLLHSASARKAHALPQQ